MWPLVGMTWEARALAEVDERGRLKPKPKIRQKRVEKDAVTTPDTRTHSAPKPKKMPARRLQQSARAGDLPHDATLEIMAGDLVLKSANAVSAPTERPCQDSSSATPVSHDAGRQRRTSVSLPCSTSLQSRPESLKSPPPGPRLSTCLRCPV